MSHTKHYIKRRQNLMREDSRCFWCKRELKLYPTIKGGKLPEDYATIDHLNSRFWGKRPEKKLTLVIACPECNNGRQAKELSKHKIRVWYKSASFPRQLDFINKILRWKRKVKRTICKNKLS